MQRAELVLHSDLFVTVSVSVAIRETMRLSRFPINSKLSEVHLVSSLV